MANKLPLITSNGEFKEMGAGDTVPAVNVEGLTTDYSINPWKYRLTGRWIGQQMNMAANTTFTFAANSIKYYPWLVLNNVTFTQMSAVVNSAGGAGTKFRFGLYNNDPATIKPSTLVIDSGEFAADSPGAKTVSSLSITLTKGLYWCAYISSASTGNMVSPAVANMYDILGYATAGASITTGYIQTLTYGALPSNAGTLTATAAASTGPMIYILI